MKKKLIKRTQVIRPNNIDLIEELQITEKEFGELISDKWDVVNGDSQLQKKALTGAKRIKELRLMLTTHRLLHRTVQ